MLHFSLQGSMAVGKTTALRFMEKDSEIHVSYESNTHVIREIKRRSLNKNSYNDYLEIQKLFIQNELRRYKESSVYECTVMDFGAEEIEFYTLNYPKAIGADWDIVNPLKKELKLLKNCFPKRILYLSATKETLLARKKGDETRNREFFDFYLQNLLPLKQEWFAKRDDVDVLEVDNVTENEMSEQVHRWVRSQMNQYVE